MIDSHQHFWKFDPRKHNWINDEMSVLKTDFLPNHLAPLLGTEGVKGGIAVQVEESETENDFLLSLAKDHIFIKGVVGWLDFLQSDISASLEYYSQFDLMKGFRYMLQGQAQRDVMLSAAFRKNIQLLSKYHFAYDILIFPDQLKYVEKLVSEFPNQVFILDHMAKPLIKSGEIDQWKKDISALAKYENVSCKVSGMVTEADWDNWKYQDFSPYLEVVFQTFGTKRLLFGSDWPVCNLAGGYQKMTGIIQHFTSKLSASEQSDFYRGNAVKSYQLA